MCDNGRSMDHIRPILRAFIAAVASMLGVWCGAATARSASAADGPDYSKELPRITPRTPDEALKSFKLQPGYRIGLAAAEPVVADPVAMHFDEDGRLFVVEMRGYPEHRDENLGQVRMLLDENHDGVFEKSTVYADKLSWPTAVHCWDGGVFVAAAPDVFFFKDTDGDGEADIRMRVFTGFGTGNVQGLVNSFRWGLDSRIHGATSSNGGAVKCVAPYWPADAPADKRVNEPGTREAINLRGMDFAFDPRTLKLEATSGGGQHGMCFDDFGRKFVCSNSDHLQMVMYEQRYLARNPYLKAPPPRLSIAIDGRQAEVFRISPVEPWRIVRTRLRVAGDVPGPIEGGGRAAGYFTGATGVTIYRGDAMRELRGMAIIGDVGSNIVHRKELYARGVEFRGTRVDQESEFIASDDIWFRPVQFGEGPDGCLYILDMYREVIEHPKSLPPVIKKHLDLTSGRGMGRIWRVWSHPIDRRNAKLSQRANKQLAQDLANDNAWHRETAARLLYQRQDESVAPVLREMLELDKQPLAQVHALWLLSTLTEIRFPEMARPVVHDQVIENALRVADRGDVHAPELRLRMDALANHRNRRVVYQLAFLLGQRRDAQRIDVLAKLLVLHAGDRWVRTAALSSAPPDTGALLVRLLDEADFRVDGDNHALLAELATMTGRFNHAPEVDSTLKRLMKLRKDDAALAAKLEAALKEGLSRAIAAAKKGEVRTIVREPPPRTPEEIGDFERRIDALRPALQLKGDAAKGKAIFTERCATCHKVADTGTEIGPSLPAFISRGPEALLANIIDPNLEVNPQFAGYTITTLDGEVLIGLISGETLTAITLAMPGGETKTILRADVETIRTSGLSLMPAQLEQGLDAQGMADLIAFLTGGN